LAALRLAAATNIESAAGVGGVVAAAASFGLAATADVQQHPMIYVQHNQLATLLVIGSELT